MSIFVISPSKRLSYMAPGSFFVNQRGWTRTQFTRTWNIKECSYRFVSYLTVTVYSNLSTPCNCANLHAICTDTPSRGNTTIVFQLSEHTGIKYWLCKYGNIIHWVVCSSFVPQYLFSLYLKWCSPHVTPALIHNTASVWPQVSCGSHSALSVEVFAWMTVTKSNSVSILGCQPCWVSVQSSSS